MKKSALVSFLLALLCLTAGSGSASAAVNCNNELTASSQLQQSGYRLNRRDNRFVQDVTLTNKSGTPFSGPVYLVLTGLNPAITLASSTDSGCTSAAGAAFQLSAESVAIDPGKSVKVTLQFSNPSQLRIAYSLRVFGGTTATSLVQSVSVNPDGILTSTPAIVTVKATVPYSGTAPTVTLERVDANGNILVNEGALVDNGNLGAGDEIAGDGIFTARKSLTVSPAQKLLFRVRAVSGATVNVSGVFAIDVVDPISDAQFNGIVSTQKTAEAAFWSLKASLGREAATQQILASLQSNPLVLQAGRAESGNGVWILFNGGILGGLLLNDPGTLGGDASAVSAISTVPSRLPTSGLSTSSKLTVLASALAPAAAAATANTEVGSQKVLLLSPFFASLSAYDVNPQLETLYKGESCPTYDVTFLKDSAVTVDVFKSLSGYGVINHYGHGDTFYNGILSLWTDQFGWNWVGAQVVVLTGQVATAANKATYQLDLKQGRLAILTGGGDYYAILPQFVSAYNANFQNSLVFINACRSSYNSTMANAFTSKGVKTYLGYTDYVEATFARDRAADFHTKWVKDPDNLVTASESFTPGLCDGSSPAACWTVAGDGTLVLPTGQLLNGNFEKGVLGAWTAVGDGRVIKQLGQFSPTEGSNMGIVSTGLGFTTQSGAISQKVCLPVDAKTLTFKWNFSSAEFKEYCGSIYQDYFRVDVAGVTLFNTTVDQLCSSVFLTGLKFDQPDVWSTGWLAKTIDISAIATANKGKPVTIQFSAGDVGDSIYDTAVLLDEIKVNK